jgi:hypothetical protein
VKVKAFSLQRELPQFGGTECLTSSHLRQGGRRAPFSLLTKSNYSYPKATMGSTCIARRAGM